MTYLTQNTELRKDGVWNFTLPAWVVELPDGDHFNVCPQAGACAKVCYARNGTYLFPKVRGKHLNNLQDARDGSFVDGILDELSSRKFRPRGVPRLVPGLYEVSHLPAWVQEWLQNGGQAVRIHDSGDFFSQDYLDAWIGIAQRTPDVLFYAYTKEVTLMARNAWALPANFRYCLSMGGKQDHLIDKDKDRHADVFPDLPAIIEAGYMSQHESDLLCVLLPTTRIGIPQNNIPHYRKRLAGRTFSQAQAERRVHAAS